MGSVVSREIDGHQIAWHDSHGTVHACEGTELHRGIFVYWTLCEIDVPAGAAEPGDAASVTCPTCRERMQTPAPPVVPDAGEAYAPAPGPENFVRPAIRKPGT